MIDNVDKYGIKYKEYFDDDWNYYIDMTTEKKDKGQLKVTTSTIGSNINNSKKFRLEEAEKIRDIIIKINGVIECEIFLLSRKEPSRFELMDI